MNIKRCISNAQAAGWITREEAQGLSRRFDELVAKIPRSAEAQAQLVAEMEAEAFQRKRRTLLTEEKRQTLERDLLSYRNKWGQQDIAEALQYVIEHHGQARFSDMASASKAIVAQAHTEFEQGLYEMRKGALTGDLRRQFGETKARGDNIVREVMGEATGDEAAAAIAKSWGRVSDGLRQRANAAGFTIGRLDGGYIPQHHDARALLNAGYEKWSREIMPLLDQERMTHPLTGGPMTDGDITRALRTVYDRITTDGWIDREPSFVAHGKGMLATQHGDHRFLHFKSADAWIEYQAKFGHGDPFAAMLSHINTLARDIAIAERLGPNPKAMMTYLGSLVQKHAASAPHIAAIRSEQVARLAAISAERGAPQAARRAEIAGLLSELDRLRVAGHGKPGRENSEGRKAIDAKLAELHKVQQEYRAIEQGLATERGDTPSRMAEIVQLFDDMRDLAPLPHMADPLGYARRKLELVGRMYDQLDGTANSPVDSRWANGFAAARNWITATTLGSAALSAITDIGFGVAARKFAGLPAMGIVGDIAQSFGRESRREAVRAGLILDSALNVLHAQARYAGSISSRTWTGFLADRTLAVSGLSSWTQAGKHAFGLEFQGFAADHAGQSFATLPDVWRRTLERHGFNAREWDLIRRAEVHSIDGGGGILRPKEIAEAAGRPLAEKYLAMIFRETTFAVPEPTIRAQVAMRGNTRPGTLIGELVRSAGQFKAFGVTVAMLQAGRVAQDVAGGEIARGAIYAGGLLIGTTLLGAVAIQLKELAGGRDPRRLDDRKLWGAALLQGGGLGIYGDFLFADVNRFGGSLGQTIAGPLADRMTTLRNLTAGNAAEAFDRDKKTTNVGREAVNFLKQNTPGSSLWYARLAYERVLFDQLQYLADPEAHAAFRRRQQTRKREVGNEFWWAPGDAAPRRAPQYSPGG